MKLYTFRNCLSEIFLRKNNPKMPYFGEEILRMATSKEMLRNHFCECKKFSKIESQERQNLVLDNKQVKLETSTFI